MQDAVTPLPGPQSIAGFDPDSRQRIPTADLKALIGLLQTELADRKKAKAQELADTIRELAREGEITAAEVARLLRKRRRGQPESPVETSG